MYNEQISLISEEKKVNDYGDMVTNRTERMVYVEVKSIGTTEFYQAQAVGKKPEIKFKIADYLDYKGEKTLLYAPFGAECEEYSIIRTYRNGRELEITCKRGVD